MTTGALALSSACGGSPSGTGLRPTNGALSGELASVGGERLGAVLVTDVVRARGGSPGEALDALVQDALLAEGARAAGLDRQSHVTWAETGVLGRSVARRAFDDARAKGPPTLDEQARLEVLQAVVFRSRSTPEPQLRFAAGAIARAVATAKSPEEFRDRARSAGSEVRMSIEILPPFDATGLTDEGKPLDPDFVAAAFQLRGPGDTSGVVETSSGWHVIRLQGRLPPMADLPGRFDELADAVVDLRARADLAHVLSTRRGRTRVDISPGADALMALAVPRQ